jgi:hypothetical protein
MLSGLPVYSSRVRAFRPISATMPTISWPGMIGNGVVVSAGVPPYWMVSPR